MPNSIDINTVTRVEDVDKYIPITDDSVVVSGKANAEGNFTEGSGGLIKIRTLKESFREGLLKEDDVYSKQAIDDKFTAQTQKDAAQDALIAGKANIGDSYTKDESNRIQASNDLAIHKLNHETHKLEAEKAENIINEKTGNPLVLHTTGLPLAGYSIHGRTTQFSTTGKNLLDKDSIDTDESYVNATGSIIGASRFCVSKVLKEGQHTYTMHNPQQVYEPAICWFDSSNTFIGGVAYNGKTNITFTTTANTAYILVSLFKPNNATVQLELGSTATSYEPYTGGEPSPSPRYPQDIHSAGEGGQIVTTKTGKNLFNINAPFSFGEIGWKEVTLENKVLYTDALSGGAISKCQKISVAPNQNMILKFKSVSNRLKIAVINIKDNSIMYTLPSWSTVGAFSEFRFNTGMATNIGISFWKIDSDVGGMSDIQLEYGDTATSYEPYKTPQTLTSDTEGGINGIGDVSDELDYENGKRIKRFGTWVFNGSSDENWFVAPTNDESKKVYVIGAIENLKAVALFKCNAYSYASGDDQWANRKEGIEVNSFSRIAIRDFRYDNDLAGFKASLASNPITVVAELATPVITDISPEEMEQFYAIDTDEPTTVLTNDADADMTARYSASLKDYIDEGDAQTRRDSRLLNLRADNLSFTLDENRLPSPLNQSIKVHVDKNNIDGDVVITGKDVAPNTMDFEVTPEDMAKDGVMLKNILTESNADWKEYVEPRVMFARIPYAEPMIPQHKYYVRVRYKFTTTNESPTTVRVYTKYGAGDDLNFEITGSLVASQEYIVSGVGRVNEANTEFGVWHKPNDGVKPFMKDEAVIDITELSARYPNLSDEELKTILDSSLPYISAQGELELGNVIMLENFIKNPTFANNGEGWSIDKGSVEYIDGTAVLNATERQELRATFTQSKKLGKSKIFASFERRPLDYTSVSIQDGYHSSLMQKQFDVVDFTNDNSYLFRFYVINKNTEPVSVSHPMFMNLTESLLDLWLSLNGYDTDEKKAEWCNEHIPFFEGTYPLWVGAIKDEHTVTATCGEYTSSLTFKTVLQKESIATQPFVDNALRDKADVITNTFRGATPFVRTDTDEEPLLGMTIYGKTEQFSTTGKNLFNKDNVDTLYNYIGADGTLHANGEFSVFKVTVTGAKTLTFSPSVGDAPALCWFDASGNYIGGKKFGGKGAITFTTTDNTVYVLVSAYRQKIDLSQIELGSSATSYEPYTGGKPSPSPDYPQEIITAGASGSIVTRVSGGNLLSFSDVEPTLVEGVTWSCKNGVIAFTGSTADAYSRSSVAGIRVDSTLLKGTYSTAVNKNNATEGLSLVISLKDSSGTRYLYDDKTFVVSENGTKMTLFLQVGKNLSSNGTASPVMSLGAEAVPFEPFKEQTLTSATPNGINGMNGVYDERDYATGKDIKRISSQITLTGNENWKLSNNRKQYFIANFDLAVGGGSEIVSNYFRRTVWDSSDAGICLSDGQSPVIGITATLFSSVDELKNWLKAKVSEGKPCVYNAKLRNPIITDIPQEETAQFNALKTYNPNTTISNDDGTEVYIKYRAETSRIVEQMAREIVRNEAIYEMGENYIKYGNGQAMCWGKFKTDPTASSAWGSIFVAKASTTYNFPLVFKSMPVVTVSIDSSSNANSGWITYVNFNKLGIQQIGYGRGTSGSSAMDFNYVAIGKWK